jgi:hypothetical protein
MLCRALGTTARHLKNLGSILRVRMSKAAPNLLPFDVDKPHGQSRRNPARVKYLQTRALGQTVGES